MSQSQAMSCLHHSHVKTSSEQCKENRLNIIKWPVFNLLYLKWKSHNAQPNRKKMESLTTTSSISMQLYSDPLYTEMTEHIQMYLLFYFIIHLCVFAFLFTQIFLYQSTTLLPHITYSLLWQNLVRKLLTFNLYLCILNIIYYI